MSQISYKPLLGQTTSQAQAVVEIELTFLLAMNDMQHMICTCINSMILFSLTCQFEES